METLEENNSSIIKQGIYRKDELMDKKRNKKQNMTPPSGRPQTHANPKEEGKDDTLERFIYVYDQVNGWIENADNKVSVSCGIFTGMFGVVSFISERISGTSVITEHWYCMYRISYIISILFLLFSFLAYVLAINPNLGSSGKSSNLQTTAKKFPIYYGDISKIKNAESYKKQIGNATDKDFIDELLEEIHYNSGICMKKMERYRRGLWFSFISVCCALLSLASRFFMYR